MTVLRVRAGGPLHGELTVPGDKSISHRAVMLSAVAYGVTRVRGLLFSEDVLATVAAFRAMRVKIKEDREKEEAVIYGRGPDQLVSSHLALDLGNSGTSMRLLAGLLAGLPVMALLIGDQSLSRRPMRRVIEPLRLMGADLGCARQGTAPIMIKGAELTGIRYRLPVASAQLKSAILLAGLFAKGETWVSEPGPSRDHTELMLPRFGVKLLRDAEWIGVRGGSRLKTASVIEVPADISSSAFFIVAALTVPGSEIVIRNVGVNPTRTGILDVLKQMGADIALENERLLGLEPVADLRVRACALRAAAIGGDLVTRAIDEIPALCIAAARARGATVIRDAKELRVKESDRIAAMARVLAAMGASVEERDDGLTIQGPADLKGAVVDSEGDHRVAMAAAVAGLSAKGETVINGAESILTSFPDFGRALTRLAS